MVALAALALTLLCTTQTWQTQRRLDPAGLAWENEVTGAALTPLGTALLPVAATAVLAALLMRPTAARQVMLALSLGAAVTATGLIALAAPTQWSGWWAVAQVASSVASVGLALLFDPRDPPRRTRHVPVSEHEQERRDQAATWAALSDGDDPTAGPSARGVPDTGRMS